MAPFNSSLLVVFCFVVHQALPFIVSTNQFAFSSRRLHSRNNEKANQNSLLFAQAENANNNVIGKKWLEEKHRQIFGTCDQTDNNNKNDEPDDTEEEVRVLLSGDMNNFSEETWRRFATEFDLDVEGVISVPREYTGAPRNIDTFREFFPETLPQNSPNQQDNEHQDDNEFLDKTQDPNKKVYSVQFVKPKKKDDVMNKKFPQRDSEYRKIYKQPTTQQHTNHNPRSYGHGPQGKEKTTSHGDFELVLNPDSSFADIGGYRHLKEELLQYADFLRNPEIYKGINVRTPRGILFSGPPGVGKTAMARALAGECGVNFILAAGTMATKRYVGEGCETIGLLFETARQNAPCFIFIDEFDAMAKRRTADSEGSNSVINQNVAKLLTELDGCLNNTGVILIGATNMPEHIDEAVRRSGRMDTIIHFDLPDEETLREIVQIHIKGKPHSSDVTMESVVNTFNGFSGAQVSSTLNDAMLIGLRRGRRYFTMQDLDEATDKLLIGKTARAHVRTSDAIYRTAVHEVGHLLVAHFLPNYREVISVKINHNSPVSAGHNRFKITEGKVMTKEDYLDHGRVLMGGRAAEGIVFDDTFSDGALGDLRSARDLLYDMMEKGFGTYPIYPDQSEAYLKIMDDHVLAMVLELENETKALLTQHKNLIPMLAKKLVEKSCLEKNEIEELIHKYKFMSSVL